MRTPRASAGLRPSSSATGTLRAVALAAFLAAAPFVFCQSSKAEEPDGAERGPRSGAFGFADPQSGVSVVEPPAGVPGRGSAGADDGSGSWFFQSVDNEPAADLAERLYKDARQALDAGRTDEAQRLFERLIAEAPASAEAAEARRHLGEIYRSAEPASAQPAAAGDPAPEGEAAPWPPAGPAVAAAPPPATLDVSPPLPAAVIRKARVSGALDGQFLSDAGDRVFFSAGSADLGARARGVLQAQARFLQQHPELSAAVEGHADDGALAEDETRRLSEARAAVVRERLIAEGVDADRLVAYGRGRDDRVANCTAAECLAQNRRAVTVLLDGPLPVEARGGRRAQGGAASPAAPTQ